MSDDLSKHKATVVEFVRAMSSGDVTSAFAKLTDDATWFSLSTREFVTRESMQAMVEWAFTSALKGPIVQTVQTMTAEDNRVAVVATGHGVTVDDVVYDQMYHFLFEFRDGLISKIWEYNDTNHAREVFRRGEGGSLSVGDLNGPPG